MLYVKLELDCIVNSCTAEITLQLVRCATQNSSGSPQNAKHCSLPTCYLNKVSCGHRDSDKQESTVFDKQSILWINMYLFDTCQLSYVNLTLVFFRMILVSTQCQCLTQLKTWLVLVWFPFIHFFQILENLLTVSIGDQCTTTIMYYLMLGRSDLQDLWHKSNAINLVKHNLTNIKWFNSLGPIADIPAIISTRRHNLCKKCQNLTKFSHIEEYKKPYKNQ